MKAENPGNLEKRKRLANLQQNVSDYTIPDDEKAPRRPRTEKEWRNYVDEQITRAMEAGDFDNLPGKGKPFLLNKNPYADPEKEMALGILKDSGYSPAWIERDKEIRKETELARNSLQAAWKRYQAQLSGEKAWQSALARFEQDLDKINRKIKDYNLIVPILSKQRMLLQLTNEVERIQQNRK